MNPLHTTCDACGQACTTDGHGGCGYGTTADGQRHCYACCAADDAAQMTQTGRATLYLTGRQGEPREVTNWPGSLRFKARYVRVGRHNIARTQTSFEFTGPDGARWTGRQYGDNSQIATCRRAKA